MTTVEVDLGVAIIQEYFGQDAAYLAKLLMTNKLNFSGLIMNLKTKMTIKQIRKILAVLDHFNIVTYSVTERGIRYTVPIEYVIRIHRVPRIMMIIKLMYGKVAEALFEEVFSQGKISCSNCIRNAIDRIQCDVDEAKNMFVRLTESQLLIRCHPTLPSDYEYPVFDALTEPFTMPSQILDGSEAFSKLSQENSRKRKATFSNPDSDAGILWCVNWPRVERFLRDDLIIDLISQNELFDDTTLDLARVVLKVGEVKADLFATQSSPIAVQEVAKYAREHDVRLSRDQIEQKLNVLGKESNGIIRKIGESGGGLFVIDYDLAFDSICRQNIESCIREKFDDRYVRVFRLLCMKGFLEEEQALRNVIMRRQHDAKQNETLSDRQLKMESVIANIRKDPNMDEETKQIQIIDVKEMYLTESDDAQLAKLKKTQAALLKAETELEQTLFVFQQYLLFKRNSCLLQSTEKKKTKKKDS